MKKTDKTPEHILNKTATTNYTITISFKTITITPRVSRRMTVIFIIIKLYILSELNPLNRCANPSTPAPRNNCFSPKETSVQIRAILFYHNSSTSYPSPTTTHLMACICSARVVSDERGICRNSLKCDVEVPVQQQRSVAVGALSRYFRKNTNRRFVLFRKSREEPICFSSLLFILILWCFCENIHVIDKVNASH